MSTIPAWVLLFYLPSCIITTVAFGGQVSKFYSMKDMDATFMMWAILFIISLVSCFITFIVGLSGALS